MSQPSNRGRSESHEVIGVCTDVDCVEPATKYMEIPSFVRGMPPHRYPYCAPHARAILRNGMSFPGARDITDQLGATRAQGHKDPS